MNDFFDRLKKELEKENANIDELFAEKGGLPDMVGAAFKGRMRRWLWFAAPIVIAVSGLMLWCGYQFYMATTVDDRIFWGVWLLVTLIVQTSMKKWSWMEMNRASTMREIKRLELAIASLKPSGE